MELIASGIAKAKRSLRFQKLLLSFLSDGCWQEWNASILIYYIGFIKWGRVDGRLLQNQMVQVGLLCFQHFPSSVLKVQTKAVCAWAGPLEFLPLQDPVQPLTGTWTGPPEAQSIGFLCPLTPRLIASHPLYLLWCSWRLTEGDRASLSGLDPDMGPFSCFSICHHSFDYPYFPKCIGQRPLRSKSWQLVVIYSLFLSVV